MGKLPKRATPYLQEYKYSFREYNLIFSDGKVDLSGFTPQGRSATKINTIFSSGTIRINSQTPVVLKINSAFGNAEMPDGNSIHLGNYNYATKSFQPDSDYLEINASVVFGALNIVER